MMERLIESPEPHIAAVPAHEWNGPEGHEAAEIYHQAALSRFVYVLEEPRYALLSRPGGVMDRAMKNVDPALKHFSRQIRVISKGRLVEGKSVRDGGYLMVGALTRDMAEAYQGAYVAQVNMLLEEMNADFRLTEFSQNANNTVQ